VCSNNRFGCAHKKLADTTLRASRLAPYFGSMFSMVPEKALGCEIGAKVLTFKTIAMIKITVPNNKDHALFH
jgi:hypothetical protein